MIEHEHFFEQYVLDTVSDLGNTEMTKKMLSSKKVNLMKETGM